MKNKYEGDQVCLFIPQKGAMIQPSAMKTVERAPQCLSR